MVKEIRGRSGAGSVPVHGLAPQNLSPDKRVDVCVDSEEDRGSTPLASTMLICSDLRCNISRNRNVSRNISTEVHFQRFAPSARIRSVVVWRTGCNQQRTRRRNVLQPLTSRCDSRLR
jgi:hypothetical protein